MQELFLLFIAFYTPLYISLLLLPSQLIWPIAKHDGGDGKNYLTLWQKPTEKQTAKDKQKHGVGVMNMLPPVVEMTL